MKLLKAGKVIALVTEIVDIIGAILSLSVVTLAFVNPQWLLEAGTFTVNGIEITKLHHQLGKPIRDTGDLKADVAYGPGDDENTIGLNQSSLTV